MFSSPLANNDQNGDKWKKEKSPVDVFPNVSDTLQIQRTKSEDEVDISVSGVQSESIGQKCSQCKRHEHSQNAIKKERIYKSTTNPNIKKKKKN